MVLDVGCGGIRTGLENKLCRDGFWHLCIRAFGSCAAIGICAFEHLCICAFDISAIERLAFVHLSGWHFSIWHLSVWHLCI